MIAAWLGALAIGLALGLLGSGGSILTVPVLVYLIGQGEKTAIAGSLFIVGSIAASGAAQFAWRRLVDWRSVVLFGLPGMAGTSLGAWLGGRVSGTLQLAVFANVMLLAAGLMFRPPTLDTEERPSRAAWKIMIDGLMVGILTGFVGVGGGFLIVPALVLLSGLSMHLAVGTSLTIIALKSFTGFYSYVGVLELLGLELDWKILSIVAGVGVLGSFAGRAIGARVSQASLRRVFAAFLIPVGLWILWQTLPEIW